MMATSKRTKSLIELADIDDPVGNNDSKDSFFHRSLSSGMFESISSQLSDETIRQSNRSNTVIHNQNPSSHGFNTNPVILLAVLELEVNGEVFVTKLRVRASELSANETREEETASRTSSSSSSSSCTRYYYNARQLRKKIQEHVGFRDFSQVQEIQIYDASVRDYVPLHNGSENVLNYGSRLRLRLVPKHEISPPPLAITGRHFDFDGTLTIDDQTLLFSEQDVPDATGFNVWDGSILLAKLLEHKDDIVRNKNVLELGSGCGVCGLAAATLGARHTTLTDLPDVIPSLEANVLRNLETIQQCNFTDDVPLTVRACDWMQPPSDLLQSRFDVILVADCVWTEDLVEPLLSVLKALTETENMIDNIEEESDDASVHSLSLEGATNLTRERRLSSMSHIELKNPPPKDDSPVCSWADIFRPGSNNNNISKDMDEEQSFSSLHEDDPPSPFMTRAKLLCEKLKTIAPQKKTRKVIDSLPVQPRQASLRPDQPRVIIAYQRRGKATHEAFRRGIHSLFSHVETLNLPPNLDVPEAFFLLSCQR
jgi:hypothetical protein